MLLHILLQILPSPDALLVEKEAFEISPTNVYGWLVYGLLGFVAYLKMESTMKSWTIRKKDKYIEVLHQKLIDSEKSSLTLEEAELYKKMFQKNQELEKINP